MNFKFGVRISILAREPVHQSEPEASLRTGLSPCFEAFKLENASGWERNLKLKLIRNHVDIVPNMFGNFGVHILTRTYRPHLPPPISGLSLLKP